MDSGLAGVAAVFCASIVALMTPFEAQTLREAAKRTGRHLALWRALLLALRSVGAGVAVFVLVVVGVGFGIPYLCGDMIGLPWFTAIPSLLLAAVAARFVNRRLNTLALTPHP